MSHKRVKMYQIESVRLTVSEQLTSAGEEILRVLEKQCTDDDVSRLNVSIRVFVLERLAAAAELICSLFQREMEELKKQHVRLLHTADVPLLPVCKEQLLQEEQQETSPSLVVQDEPEAGGYQDFHYLCEETSPGQQERSPSPFQEEPDSPQIKEEQEELLLRPEEGHGSALTSPTMKSEDEDDENKEEDPPAGTSVEHMKTQAYIKYWGGSQPTGDDEDSDNEWEETREAQSVGQDLEPSKQAPPKTHTGEKPFSCEICGKGCNYRCELKKHMSTHTGEKPFNCTICGKGCNYMCDLKKHMRTHTGEKAFICTVCGKGCSYMCDLKNHMRTHTGEKPFSCTVCGNSFSVKTNLSQHMRIHTGDKTFSCSICSKVFVQMSNLKRHMRTHTGEKPFNCTDPLVYSLWQQL